LKLLFYIEHFRNIGGAENLAISVCKELKKRGYRISVVSKDGEDLEGIRIYRNFSEIKEIIKKERPDVTFDWGLFERADISRLGGSIHRIFLRYSLYSYPILLRPVKWLYYRLSKKHQEKIRHQEYVLSKTDTLFICPSHFVKKHALEYGIPERNLRVIYNGVDLERFFPCEEKRKNSEKERWGLKDKTVFVFVAHNLRLKNIGLLKAVFDDLYRKYPEIRLLVVGKRKPSFRRPYLMWTGFMKDIRKVYTVADVLLHPSYFDTFGSVVIEAMASGIPVLVSEFCGASEIVEDGGKVLPVVGRGVKDVWKDEIERIMDKDERRIISENARRIAKKYDLISYVDKIEGLFK